MGMSLGEAWKHVSEADANAFNESRLQQVSFMQGGDENTTVLIRTCLCSQLFWVVATASSFWHFRGLRQGDGNQADEPNRIEEQREQTGKPGKDGGKKHGQKAEKQKEGGKAKRPTGKEKSKQHKDGGKDQERNGEDNEMRGKDTVSRQFEITSSIGHTPLAC